MSESENNKTDPPVVEVKVRNPVTYIKLWWNKVIGNEGMEFCLRIKPLTAILIAVVVASIGFGVGSFIFPSDLRIPFFKFKDDSVVFTPTPTAQAWKETAYTGTLRFSEETKKYYLVTTSSEAITLEVPENFVLESLVGKRIFATGMYNKQTRVLKILDAKDTEVLSKSPVAVPTVSVSPTPVESPTSTPSASPAVD